MATTGELRTIIEELELVDIGDAASYLGEEGTVAEESQVSDQTAFTYVDSMGFFVADDYTLTQRR